MSRLVIAEKPSVAASLAKVLKASARKDGYFEGNGWIVSWCVGHLVELEPPESYDEKYKKWRREDLPILPDHWRYAVSASTKKQFGILKKLMERSNVDRLCCATDAGREGELIFRLVYHQAHCRKPFDRLWISSMEDSAIQEGFASLRPSTDYDALYEAALCRERADWIVGMNATRLYSCLYGSTLNVGRVMTPTLAMLVDREQSIRDFVPETFYTVQLQSDGLKASGRKYKDKTEAEEQAERCRSEGQMSVTKVVMKDKSEKPPLLYDLTSLQRDANKILGYSAQQTLDYLQSLYEKKLVTYPRTDSRYLTEDMAAGLPQLAKTVAGALEYSDPVPVNVKQVINNAKVSDHHAVIPTKEVSTEPLPEKPAGNYRMVPEEDMQRYEFQEKLFQTIVSVEADAHNEEDPMAIAVRVMKACCDFYDADWCGILIADLQTQVFIPEIWYEPGIGPMQDTLFNDIEFTEEFATWAQHLIEQKPLIIPDAEKIREINPKEYEAYQRLEARSIMGVPFGQHPLGFMVIRNMKQYTDRPEPLQLACFVAMMMLEQIRRTRMEKLTKMHDEDDGRFRIRYNILGPHNFVIDGKEIYEQDLPHPNRRAWIIMLYMVLHKRPVDQQKLIADNWPDEEVDTARNNMRQAIFRLHNDLSAYHDVKVIDTRSRMMDFSGEVNVTTDADEMEDLYNRAKNLPDGDDKIILLKKAFELYRGRLFIQGEDDIGTWLYTYTSHYNQVYVDLTSALLTTLGHIKDYRCIMDYGPRALEIEPGILTAYYWIIIAADETGNSVAREKFLQKAAEDLIDEENEKLMKLLALQNHMS